MWKYIKKYLPFAILAALFMVGEVMMDLIQPGLMSKIVDDGVLGVSTGGTGDLQVIWQLGIRMILLVLFGGFCGSMNNVFVHMSGQNIGNEIRKDCFRRMMTFSFPQLDRYGAGSLVTRVTNDITQVQNFVSESFETAAIGKTAESNLQGMRKSIHAQAVGCSLLFQCLPPAGLSPERYG